MFSIASTNRSTPIDRRIRRDVNGGQVNRHHINPRRQFPPSPDPAAAADRLDLDRADAAGSRLANDLKTPSLCRSGSPTPARVSRTSSAADNCEKIRPAVRRSWAADRSHKCQAGISAMSPAWCSVQAQLAPKAVAFAD